MMAVLPLFDALVKTSGDAVWRAGEDGVVHLCARGAAVGEARAWAAREWRRLIHRDDLAAVTGAFENAGDDAVVELNFRSTAAGAPRWMRLRATRVLDSAGRPHWIGVLQDIDDQVRATEELRHNEQVYRALVQAAAAVLWRADPDGGCIDLQGWSNLERLRGLDWLQEVHPDDVVSVRAWMDEIVRAGETSTFRYRVRNPEGEYRLCETRAVPIRDTQGAVVEWVGTLTDIEDRVVAEQAMQQAERLKSVGRLTAGVAHDFNNLLTVITASAEAIAGGLTPDDPLRAQADMALHAAERGADLVSGLLAFSRQQPLQPRAVDLEALFRRLEPLIRRLIGEDIEFEVRRAPGAGACLADPAQLETAIVNLCVNARDAMPKGGRLRLEADTVVFSDEAAPHMALKPGAYVLLSVIDTGEGMSAEVLDRAIEPFFTTKPAGEGSGLGLSMVYGFVKQSAGQMTLASTPGQGARVRLYLPRAQATDAPPAPEPAGADFTGTKVLLVEDDPLVRRQVTHQLQELGFRTAVAANAPEALERLAADRFDLLMTDIIMPGGLDGFELAQEARKRAPEMRVLFISGYTDERVALRAPMPRSAFLQKPYRRAALARTLQAVMGEKAAAA